MPWTPVPGEVHVDRMTGELLAAGAALAQCPADEEVKSLGPLRGDSGILWNGLLQDAGHNRPTFDIFNVIACRPPGPASGGWEKMDAAIAETRKDETKKLVAADWKKAPAEREAIRRIPHPADCCRPRLVYDLEPYDGIICLGKVARAAITGKNQPIGRVAGSPESATFGGRDRLIVTTYHPSALLPGWAPGLRFGVVRHLAKAWRYFTGNLRWIEPERTLIESPSQLASWMDEYSPWWAFDTETSGISALEVAVEMVQLATPDLDASGDVTEDQYLAQQEGRISRTMALCFVDEDGQPTWTIEDLNEIRGLLVPFLEDPTIPKVGTNVGFFDRLCLRKSKFRKLPFLIADVRGIFDRLFAARSVSPDAPKGLKANAVIYTDATNWETNEAGEKNAVGRNTPERIAYGQTDGTAEARTSAIQIPMAAANGMFDPLPASYKPEAWDRVTAEHATTWVENPGPRPFNLWEVDHMAQAMCCNMTEIGVHIDQRRRLELEIATRDSLVARRVKLLKLKEAAGIKQNLDELLADVEDSDDGTDAEDREDLDDAEVAEEAMRLAGADLGSFVYNSTGKVRALLYEEWGLTIPQGLAKKEFFTKSGKQGTSDKVIRAHLASGRLNKAQQAFLYDLRMARREANKILGTVLVPLRTRKMDPKRGLVWPDGRVRSTWNAHVQAPGRLSSSRPNLTTIGSRKGMGVLQEALTFEDGHLGFGFDLEQAHLRIVANFWKIQRLIDCFVNGYDAHNLLAHDVEVDKFLRADGGEKWNTLSKDEKLKKKPGRVLRNGQWEKSPALSVREFFKTLRYLLIYRGSSATAHLSLQSTETDNGELIYLKVKKQTVERIRRTFLKVEPDWEPAWEAMQAEYEENARRNNGVGFLVGPVSGRRSGVLGLGKEQETANSSVLETEAIIMRLAECQMIDRFPWDMDARTGIVAQIHDALKLELVDPGRGLTDSAAKEARDRIVREIEEIAEVHIPGWDIPFKVEAHWGRHFGEL